MRDKGLKKLRRGELLEMMIAQSKRIAELEEELALAKAKLSEREIMIQEAGSIAEAALRCNGVYEAAQAAAQQYLESIKLMRARQKAVCARMEAETREKCAELLNAARREANKLSDKGVNHQKERRDDSHA